MGSDDFESGGRERGQEAGLAGLPPTAPHSQPVTPASPSPRLWAAVVHQAVPSRRR